MARSEHYSFAKEEHNISCAPNTFQSVCWGFFNSKVSHVGMWELNHKEGRVQKNRCFWIAVSEKTLWSPLDYKEIKPVNPKGNQPWIFIGSTNVEAEAPILWPPDVKSQFIGKDPDAGKDWRQEEKGATEAEMAESPNSGINLSKFQETVKLQETLASCSP